MSRLHKIYCDFRVSSHKIPYNLYWKWNLKSLPLVLTSIMLKQINSLGNILYLLVMTCCHSCPFKALFIVIIWINDYLLFCFAALYRRELPCVNANLWKSICKCMVWSNLKLLSGICEFSAWILRFPILLSSRNFAIKLLNGISTLM